jgi:hypothetical protein
MKRTQPSQKERKKERKKERERYAQNSELADTIPPHSKLV